MNTKFVYRLAFLVIFLFSSNFCYSTDETLSLDDVHLVMEKILEQHVDKRAVTGDVLKNSYKVYIDQFDPEKQYLFESEVEPFLSLGQVQMNQVLVDYQKNDYSKYEELNRIIQNAIRRARIIRKEILAQGDALFHKSSSQPREIPEEGTSAPKTFPKNMDGLKKGIEEDIVLFIGEERTRSGDRYVMENKDKVIGFYERMKTSHENKYLYLDDQGRQLPESEKENLFAMHILKALSRSLDSHTSYLNANEAYNMKIRLEKGFHGIGVVLEQKPQGIAISRFVEGGPAQKSGMVKIGDIISKINGENVEGYSLEELINKLRDETRSNVFLVIRRQVEENGRPFERTIPVTLQRELIAVDEGRVEADHEEVADGIIGKIALLSFYQGANGITSEKDMRRAINDLKKKGHLRGLVLDLRENSGGFLNQAVKVAGLFITNGVVVVSKYSNGEEKYYRDMDGKVSFDGPLVVLTSKATASAAEIVAQALQDYGVAVIVGDEHTYGKGTIQSQTVTDGQATSHFKVTVGKYYTVSGKTPQVQGVKADIVVPGHYSRERIGEEYLQLSLGADTISDSYKDELVDIDPSLKPWYLRYYVPTLQKKETGWKELIPVLQKNSGGRMQANAGFKQFLNDGNSLLVNGNDSEGSSLQPDYQMQEAINILKDMISLERQYKNGGVAEH